MFRKREHGFREGPSAGGEHVNRAELNIEPSSAARPAGVEVMDRNRELLSRAREVIYKEVDGAYLKGWIFEPEAAQGFEGPRPACLFFSASLWDQHLVSQFAPHCVYLAARGLVSMVMEYRQRSGHGTTPVEAIADAKSAVRWTRLNAESLGVDPGRIAAGGASGGGHIALCAALLDGWDEEGEPPEVSARPDALLLFNPVVDTTPKGVGCERFRSRQEAVRTSPSKNVRKGAPPALVLHGTLDRVVPFEQVQKFVRRMRRRKNAWRLETFEGRGHGFFHFNVSAENFEASLVLLHDFLAEHGFLERDEEESMHLLSSWRS